MANRAKGSEVAESFEAVAERLRTAKSPEELFGKLEGAPEEQLRAARAIYHQLIRIVHPDIAGDGEVHAGAWLNDLWGRVQAKIASGTYATEVIRTKRYKYALGKLLTSTDIADVFACVIRTDTVGVFKIVKDARDNDLMQTEFGILRALYGADPTSKKMAPWAVPEIVESFLCQHRRATVFSHHHDGDWFTLAQVMEAYPNGIDQRDMAWMWRRLLDVLGFVHGRGYIHGAVLPQHIWINPEGHVMELTDWNYAVRDTPIKAISPRYEGWYGREVAAKDVPGPGLDIMMSARCMIKLMGGDPITGEVDIHPRLRAFLKSCLLPLPNQRPQNAWQLLDEFTELIEDLWGPRTFRPFHMPAR